MSSSAHFPDSSSFQHQSDQFVSWLESIPGVKVNSNILLADLRSKAAGRGVVARSNIPEGEELFSIPRSAILAVQNSQLKSLLTQDVDALGPWLSLMLVMLYEFLQGDQSKWASYFRVLPTRFDTLMFWSDAELRDLQASAILDKIGKQGAEDSILESIAPIVRANPGLFQPINGLASFDGDAGTAALLELAHMMGSLIMAYAFDIEKAEEDDEDVENPDESYMTDDEEEQLSKGMVPLADLLNADADRNNARLYQEEESLVMKSIKPIQEGEEIFNDYGEIPRADLLRRYGYVTDNYSPFDVIELSLADICQAAGLTSSDVESQPRLQLLEEHDLLDDGYVIPRPSVNDALENILPIELVALLTILTQSPEEFEQRRSKNKPPRSAIENNQAALLYKALQSKQVQYGTSLDQDFQLLNGLVPPPQSPASLEGSARRHKMALQVRIGEKEVLQSVLTLLDRLAAAGSLKRTANGDVSDSRHFKAPRV